MAAARIATPVMTTVVPDCPDDGSTDRMVDWLTYWKLAALVTVAPSLFVMTIGPDCVLPAPSSTTMEEDETALRQWVCKEAPQAPTKPTDGPVDAQGKAEAFREAWRKVMLPTEQDGRPTASHLGHLIGETQVSPSLSPWVS